MAVSEASFGSKTSLATEISTVFRRAASAEWQRAKRASAAKPALPLRYQLYFNAQRLPTASEASFGREISLATEISTVYRQPAGVGYSSTEAPAPRSGGGRSGGGPASQRQVARAAGCSSSEAPAPRSRGGPAVQRWEARAAGNSRSAKRRGARAAGHSCIEAPAPRIRGGPAQRATVALRPPLREAEGGPLSGPQFH